MILRIANTVIDTDFIVAIYIWETIDRGTPVCAVSVVLRNGERLVLQEFSSAIEAERFLAQVKLMWESTFA